MTPLVILQHAVHQVSHRSPEVLATCVQTMLVHEQYVMLEASIQVRLEAKLQDHWVVVAVDVGVNAIEPLKELLDHARESTWELYSCNTGVRKNVTLASAERYLMSYLYG